MSAVLLPGADHRRALGAFVAEQGTLRELAVGETLFTEGDRSTAAFACTEGRINLFVTSPSGRELILGTKTPIQGFGELSAISGAPRTATAVAMAPSTVTVMPGADFLRYVENDSTLAVTILRELARHLATANLRLAARSVDSTNKRVAQLLIDLGLKLDRHADPEHRSATGTQVAITQDEVAAWVGSTREAAARSLAFLRECGAVRTGRGRITILHPDLLMQLASGESALF